MEVPHPALRVCAFEDRAVAMDSLLFMAESLCAADRNISLHLTVPDAPDYIHAWARSRPEVTISTERPEGVSGWDVKPWLLLQQLNEGLPEAVWIDDDMIVTGSIAKMLQQFPSDTLVVSAEWGDWPVQACQFWGLPPGRPIQLFNACFIRATAAHRPLLERYLELARDPRNQEFQKLPYEQRPKPASGDSWLLVALLESEEFAQLPFACIRRGRHIAQCAGSSGYRPLHRVLDLFRGLPPLIHGLGRKPWDVPQETGRVQRFLLDLATDVSPYTLAARKVAKKVGRFPGWLRPRTRIGAACRALTANHPGMAGLPLSCLHALHLSIGRMMRREQ